MKYRVIGIIIASILAIWLAAHWLLPARVQGALEDELTRALEQEAPGQYVVDIPGLHFNLLFTRMNVDAVSLTLPDKDYSRQALAGMPPRLMEMKLQDLEISTWGLAALALKWQNVTFSHLQVASATISMLANPESETPEQAQGTDFPDRLSVNNISIENLNLEMRHLAEPDIVRQLVSLLQARGELEVNDGQLRIRHNISAHQIAYEDALHTYSLQQLDYDQDQQGLRLKGLQISPNYDKEAFSRQIRFQKDRYDLLIDSVVVAALDLEALLNRKLLRADSITIGGGQLEVYRDRSVPFDTTQRRELPVSLIRKASLALDIGKVRIAGLDVDYTERPENGGSQATIPFHGLQATLSNITNIGQDLERDSLMHITAQAHTIGEALLQAQFTYNLKDPRGGFQARGELGALQLERLNPVLIPLAGAEINRGTLSGITFSFGGNDIEASGTLRMRYSDLDVTLEAGRSALRRNIVSWAARTFVYHPANPASDEALREASIEQERDPSRFVFNYWWKSFFSGIKNTVLR